MTRRVAIIGAGPIGLAAAHGALLRGYVPTVFEKETPGASLRRFGPVRLFTPLAMNLPPGLLSLAPATPGDALVTGPELADILTHVAESDTLRPFVKLHHRVIHVTRGALPRGELAGHAVRGELPFRLVVETKGHEEAFVADAVLDASGVYGSPVPLAAPGASTLGRRAIRTLGELYERRADVAGKRVLLLGHGHSAAHAIAWLAEEGAPAATTWAVATRSKRPVDDVLSDPLPERSRVVARANDLAAAPPPWLRVERNATVEGFEDRSDSIAVHAGERVFEVDLVVALLGSRPDLALLSELPVEISARTEGAMRLSAALVNVTDCLSAPTLHPEDLASGEPRFHLVGSKSYGRAPTFLLQSGYAQLETILGSLFDS